MTIPAQGRYAVLHEIARGGMGVLLETVDRDLQRSVAMKVMLDGRDPLALARFLLEARTTGQLEHPSIVPIHEIGVDEDERVFFTMKRVRGSTLEEILDRCADGDPGAAGGVPRARLLDIFLRICEAVEFAHSRGVIHRDLKPANVMVGDFGEVLVVDWGLAKSLGAPDPGPGAPKPGGRAADPGGPASRVTLDGDVLGTPAYMPPEQARGDLDRVGIPSDVFALGAILYQILTFVPPHAGATVEEVLRQARAARVTRARRRAPRLRIPAELESVAAKALSFEPADRYPSVAALAADVRAYQDRRPVSAHAYAPTQRVIRAVQRHPAGALAGAVAFVLVAAIAAATGVLGMRAAAGHARARELEARAAREAARAEVESLRAGLAERERREAEDLAAAAEAGLEKGRAVSAVLRAAGSELAAPLMTLRTAFYSGASREKKKRVLDEVWPAVEAFSRAQKTDSASQAALLAVQGWFKRLGNRHDEARALFRKARETDPDVAWGWLFEAAMYLSMYLNLQTPPDIRADGAGIVFVPLPPEPEILRTVRERFTRLLGEAREARVWGEVSSRVFRDTLEGFLQIRGGDLEKAERDLSRALGVQEFVWIDTEILLARAIVRYRAGKFDSGLADIEKILSRFPSDWTPRFLRAYFLYARAVQGRIRGEDAREGFGAAAEAYARLRPSKTHKAVVLSNRSIALFGLAEARLAAGEDPTPDFEAAVAEGEKAAAADPAYLSPLLNLGLFHRTRAGFLSDTNRDPLPFLRLSIERFEAARALAPDSAVAEDGLGTSLQHLGRALLERGEDPREAYRNAVEAYGRALEIDPGSASVLLNRAGVRHALAEAAAARGDDPTAFLDAASADCDAVLARDPTNPRAHANRAVSGIRLGEFARSRGRDPSGPLRQAVADLRRAVDLRPADPTFWGNLGVARFRLGEWIASTPEDPLPVFRESLEAYDRALALRAADASMLANRANTHLAMARATLARGGDAALSFEKSLEDCAAALARAPGFLNALLCRCRACLALGRAEKAPSAAALDHFERAVEAAEEIARRRPRDADSHLLRGEALTLLGETRARAGGDGHPVLLRSLEAFEEAAALRPASSEAHSGAALVHQVLGRVEAQAGRDGGPHYDRALAAYGRALARDPKDWRVLANRGLLEEHLGRFAQAAASLEAAVAACGDTQPVLRAMRDRVREKAAAGEGR